jgi:PDZ domain-containing secreted protein
MMWKKGNTIIAINDKLFENDEDDRIELEKVPNGNKLSIRLAEEEDAGEYICQVTAAETIELVHDVQIRGDSPKTINQI